MEETGHTAPQKGPLSPEQRDALRQILLRLEYSAVQWALTGSAGHALQGVPVPVHDIDLQTDRAGAYRIAALFADAMAEPVALRESAKLRSHLGAMVIGVVSVEIIGGLQKGLPGGGWTAPVDVTAFRIWVSWRGLRVPVLALDYEWRAYEALGRHERAALLRRHAPGN